MMVKYTKSTKSKMAIYLKILDYNYCCINVKTSYYYKCEIHYYLSKTTKVLLVEYT